MRHSFLRVNKSVNSLNLVDHDNIPVLAYGLRTDFRGETFEGSQYLLAWADDIRGKSRQFAVVAKRLR